MRFHSLALTSALVLSCSAADHPTATTATDTPAAPVAAAPAEARFAVPVDGLPTIGDSDALVTIVEFTDYECPYCAKAEKTMRELRASYGHDLRFAVAMHPLPMHPHARDAALVALDSTHFEETHAHLFEVGGVAGENERRAPFESLATAEQLGSKLRVHGTPTFFVNGKRVTGAQPYATFDKMISHELATARALVAAGTRPSRVYDAILDEARENPAPLPPDDDAPKLVPAAVGVSGLPFLGRDDAGKTIVLFTDLECPYCKRLDARLRDLTKTNADVRVVFRNHPLPMHPHARLAAKAAIAAASQNGLARFVEIAFAHQDALERASLVSYASQAGLDVPRFTRDLDSDETARALAADEALATKLDVTGTPSSFVEGKLVVGAQPLTTFEEALH
ncbi:MAG TPA: thioredoxin domain-containing protein [Polyangiaceae bacterium]|jgi:protein-disulfide isomerase|nr:thioredoxin domain-containing protein [Polyangiaceae bacterium]